MNNCFLNSNSLCVFLLWCAMFIFNRYEQTEKESDILLKVKTDLTQLDELVTQDVAILRSKIEEANKVYTIAR